MTQTLRRHWPEYLMEAGELATFMVSAALFASLLDHPASPVRQFVGSPILRRLITGLLMGTTAICLVQSPWGRQSGAHMNPSLTLTFLRLGKIARPDACFYVVAQFIGAVIGITAAATLIGPALGSPEVNYVATTPGARGSGAAFAAELAISFVLMLTVLLASNTVRLARFTPLLVGALIATYITLEAPLSGMSMNPARTFGPALFGRIWDALWIYFTAPPLGMLMAAELYVRARGTRSVLCAKLHHLNDRRCIFHCGYSMSVQTGRAD
jgi:aquaporin Z